MSAGKYRLLTFLSVVIAVLVLLEIICENQVALLTSQVTFDQNRVAQSQQQSIVVRQLLQRIAIESQHDPALLELLTKRGIHVTSPTGMAPSLPAGATDLIPAPKSSNSQ